MWALCGASVTGIVCAQRRAGNLSVSQNCLKISFAARRDIFDDLQSIVIQRCDELAAWGRGQVT
jgi:hypothetical protein